MSDLVECLIFIGLALMFVYSVFVVVRFSRRYSLARRETGALVPDLLPASQPGSKRLLAELSRGVGTLKSIAAGAPFLGLAGTCYGIGLLSSRGIAVSKVTSSAAISLEVATALVAAAAGLIVAIPAAISYNILRTRLEQFESSRSSTLLDSAPRSYGFAQTLPLRGRFSGFPAFALIGAPVLGLLVPIGALMLRSLSSDSVGLPVHLLKISAGDHDLAPIIVNVISANESGRLLLYLNSKETSWQELRNTLRDQLEVRPRWIIYVEGGDDVEWTHVADVIDVARGLHAEVVLLPAESNTDSRQSRKSRSSN